MKRLFYFKNQFCNYFLLCLILFLSNKIFACDCLGYYELNNSNAKIIHTHGSRNCVGYAFSGANSDMGTLTQQERVDIYIDEEYARNYFESWGFYQQTQITSSGNIAIWDTPSGGKI